MSEISKLHLKLGHLELEFEGDGAFLGSGLVETIERLTELQAKHPLRTSEALDSDSKGSDREAKDVNSTSATLTHSTQTIAALLKVTSCSDLVIAASAHLSISKQKATFTRGEIQAEMRAAPSFYKQSFRGGNLTSAIETLTRADRLRLHSSNTYSLSAREKTQLEKTLAEAE